MISLLPAATELVAALGAADQLVGVSHECDYPPGVRHLPRVTSTPVDSSAPGAAIDAEVRRLRGAGRPVIALDAEQVARLAPDLIIAQGLCEVCAVDRGTVHRLVSWHGGPGLGPRVLELEARDFAGICADARTIGRALGREREADALADDLGRRLAEMARAPDSRPPTARRRVVCVEWLEPPYLAGHWVPELVAAAGGRDVGAQPGSPSRPCSWGEIAALAPDVIVIMLCGFDVSRASGELAGLNDPRALALFRRVPTWVLDGNAYTSRPGPRVIEGAERIRQALLGSEGPGLVRWRGDGKGG